MLNGDEIVKFLEDSAMVNTAESFMSFASTSPTLKRLRQC